MITLINEMILKGAFKKIDEGTFIIRTKFGKFLVCEEEIELEVYSINTKVSLPMGLSKIGSIAL